MARAALYRARPGQHGTVQGEGRAALYRARAVQALHKGEGSTVLYRARAALYKGEAQGSTVHGEGSALGQGSTALYRAMAVPWGRAALHCAGQGTVQGEARAAALHCAE